MSPWTLAINNLANLAPIEALKTCGRCKQDKRISEFYRMGGRISHACKECHKAESRRWRHGKQGYSDGMATD
jgi:hypothetical protein